MIYLDAYSLLEPDNLLISTEWYIMDKSDKRLFVDNINRIIIYREYDVHDISNSCNIPIDILHALIKGECKLQYKDICSISSYVQIPVLRLTHTEITISDLIVLDSLDPSDVMCAYIEVNNDIYNNPKYSNLVYSA